jgi:hypothetical protein
VEALFGDVARRARYARPDQLLESSLGVIFQRPPTAKILGIFATRSRHVLIAAVDRRVRQNVLLPL